MALPSNVGVVVVHGFWLDETTGHGVRRSDGHPATVTFEPVSLTGDPDAPNVRDSGAHTHIKTRTRVARVDPDTGYYAAILVASDDPDIDPYGGRRVTFSEEDPFVVEVPYNAPLTTVDALMAAATGLAQGSSVAALPLVQAALLELPAPAPPIAYLTSTQVLSTVVTAIEAHDDDPQAHGAGPVTLTDAPEIVTDAGLGSVFTVTLNGSRTLADPTNLAADQRLMWRIVQDGTGSHTLTLGPAFNVNPLITGPITLSTAAHAVDYLGGIYRASANKIDVLAFGRGF